MKCAKMSTVCMALLALSPALGRTADGPVGGPIVRLDTVPGGKIDAYTVPLHAGGPTRIQVVGNGQTCLELRVHDARGKLVASDTIGFGDNRKVVFTPAQVGTYTVTIHNPGVVANKYVIALD